ncbi:MAG: hypothetical protein JRN21_01005 [Nitrososphaerota archaeon]|nr:hypothetical protein [Nitrososphaerota archaeon]
MKIGPKAIRRADSPADRVVSAQFRENAVSGHVGQRDDGEPGDVLPFEAGLGPPDERKQREERDAGDEPSHQRQVDRRHLGHHDLDGHESHPSD